MEDFEVDGTTLLNWTMRVQAHNEREALDEAQGIACCRVTDPDNE
jgi:hypothetical protein